MIHWSHRSIRLIKNILLEKRNTIREKSLAEKRCSSNYLNKLDNFSKYFCFK